MCEGTSSRNIPSKSYSSGSDDGDNARLVVRILVAILHGVWEWYNVMLIKHVPRAEGR